MVPWTVCRGILLSSCTSPVNQTLFVCRKTLFNARIIRNLRRPPNLLYLCCPTSFPTIPLSIQTPHCVKTGSPQSFPVRYSTFNDTRPVSSSLIPSVLFAEEPETHQALLPSETATTQLCSERGLHCCHSPTCLMGTSPFPAHLLKTIPAPELVWLSG